MIFIEGPDRCGKSTVAGVIKRLAQCVDWPLRHHTVPPVTAFPYYAWFLAGARPRHVVDRAYLSELVYGPMYRDSADLTDHQVRLLELCALTQGGIVIYLNDTPTNIAHRLLDEHPDADVSRTAELVSRFNEVMLKTRLPVFSCRLRDLVDDRNRPTEYLFKLVLLSISRASKAERLPPPSIGYGDPTGFIIMAEEPNYAGIKDSYGVELPLCWGPSSDWLWRALDEAGIDWWQGYYTNASAFHSPEAFREFVIDWDPSQVVCLGTRATNLASDARVPHKSLRHPMYARRFQHHQFTEYRNAFADALSEFIIRE